MDIKKCFENNNLINLEEFEVTLAKDDIQVLDNLKQIKIKILEKVTQVIKNEK